MFPQDLQLLLNNNDWGGIENYINTLQKPLSQDIKECLAWSYSRQEKYNEAIVIYDELLCEQPNNAKWLYSKGYQYYAQKDYQNAVIYFEEALTVYPNYIKVKYRISYAYIQLAGNERQWTKDVFWKAINHLKSAHDIYKNFTIEEQEKNRSTYADICALHGRTLVGSSKYIDLAINYLERSLSLKEDLDVRYQLAKAYYFKKDYTKALELLPTQGKVAYYILELKSQIYADNGQVEKSNEVLFTLLKFRKKDYIYQRLSNNFLLLNNMDEALKYAQLALICGKRNYKNIFLCGQVCYKKAMYRESYDYLQKARKQKQKDYNLDLPEAIELMDKIIHVTNNFSLCEDKLCEGIISQYNPERGFGFIGIPTDSERFFFHISQFANMPQPKVGVRVKFMKEQTPKGCQAKNIKYV